MNNQVATFERVNASEVLDDDNKGYVYGINWIDGLEVVDCEWFKTEAEREQAIDKFFESN